VSKFRWQKVGSRGWSGSRYMNCYFSICICATAKSNLEQYHGAATVAEVFLVSWGKRRDRSLQQVRAASFRILRSPTFGITLLLYAFVTCTNPWNAKLHLNCIWKFISYRAVNTSYRL